MANRPRKKSEQARISLVTNHSNHHVCDSFHQHELAWLGAIGQNPSSISMKLLHRDNMLLLGTETTHTNSNRRIDFSPRRSDGLTHRIVDEKNNMGWRLRDCGQVRDNASSFEDALQSPISIFLWSQFIIFPVMIPQTGECDHSVGPIVW